MTQERNAYSAIFFVRLVGRQIFLKVGQKIRIEMEFTQIAVQAMWTEKQAGQRV
jgi:hypothetical protein